MTLELIRNSAASKMTRWDRLDGKEFLVVPSVMITVGVHNGSSGPLYYPEDEVSKTPAVWNAKPVVVYHPEKDGQGVSACDPIVLENRSVGMLLNTRYNDGRLPTEAWIDPKKADKVDERIMAAVEKGEMLEVSTGLFTDNEQTEGEFNGKKYVAIARNYRPDHLAILPDKLGACSIADGAGFLRLNEAMKDDPKLMQRVLAHALTSVGGPALNELSFDQTRQTLYELLRAKFPNEDSLWIEDVYQSGVIFFRNDHLYLLGYSRVNDRVSLTDEEPMLVARKVTYIDTEGSTVFNSAKDEEPTMELKEMVDGLISNAKTAWTADHRDQLMKTPEPIVKSMHDQMVANDAKADDEPPATKPGDKAKKNDAPADDVTPAPAQNEAKWEDLIPADVKEVIEESLVMRNEARGSLIQGILANNSNTFTEDELKSMPLKQLQGVAKLAKVAAPTPTANGSGGLGRLGMLIDNAQSGSGGEAPVSNNAKPLELPSL